MRKSYTSQTGRGLVTVAVPGKDSADSYHYCRGDDAAVAVVIVDEPYLTANRARRGGGRSPAKNRPLRPWSNGVASAVDQVCQELVEAIEVNRSVGLPPGGTFGMSSDVDELTIRLRQQALLAEIGRRALSDLEFDALLEEACRLTALGLDIRFCKVLQYLPDQNSLLVRAGVGWHEGVVGHAVIGAELDSPAGYALHTGKPVISNQLSTEQRFRTPGLLIDHGVQRAANVILLGEGRPYGVLEVDSESDGAFTEHDIDFLQSVANLLGIALERRQAEEELRQLNATLEQRVEQEIAERRQAEDALRQSQKMEAIGRLTGGVAHDFNNLLMVIIGNLDLLARALDGTERHESLITTAQNAAARGAQLTSQLLAFARRQTLRPESRPINELIREFDVLASRVLGEDIQVAFALDPSAGATHIDPSQFGSALLNLVVNARDAMPSGGRLTIRTANVTLDARMAARYPDALPGDYVMVEVTDSGGGMPPEVLERATEPFFTTKGPGKGTGLGLSQVHGFVRQSGGFLTLESTVGSGTTVRIYLPQVTAAALSLPQSPTPTSGSGTVLVVEDDPDVLNVVLAQLEDLGYATLAATNGPEALHILQAPETPVDVLLTDIVMPGGMTGLELVRAARGVRPDLPAVLTSGYIAGSTAAPMAGEADPAARLPVLSKPYQQEELAHVIAQALARS
jgi:signal transduction histidine kinase/ActR/RegA family two-component response regulator